MFCVQCQTETDSDRPHCQTCGKDPELQGRFRLESVWRRTESSVVYRALDRARSQSVAVKMVPVGPAVSPQVVAAAELEARLLQQLRHSAVPNLISSSHIGTGNEEKLCIVMDLIEGSNLAEVIQNERMTERQILLILDAVTAICEDLHSLRPPVIHRDLQPSNLIRNPDQKWILVDFQAAQEDLRQESGPEPQLGYSAPEQLAGESGPGTDLFSVGVIGVHLLSRRHPTDLWTRAGTLDWKNQVQASTPTMEALQAVLTLDASHRLADARLFRQKLQHALSHLEKEHLPTSPKSMPQAPASPPTKHRGDHLLGLSILGIFCMGLILGPLVAFLARTDLKEMKEGRMDPAGRAQTKSAYYISLAVLILNFGTIICALGMNVWIVLFEAV